MGCNPDTQEVLGTSKAKAKKNKKTNNSKNKAVKPPINKI